MRLTDVMSNSGLSGYAIFALVLFVAAFAVVVLLTFAPGAAERHRKAAQLPLDDENKASLPASRAEE